MRFKGFTFLINLFDYISKLDFVIILLLFIFGLLVLFIFLIFIHNQKKKLNKRLNKIDCTKIFTIDFNNNLIIYYDEANPSEKHEMEIENFYASFKNKELNENFRNWIKSIQTDNNTYSNQFICFNYNSSLNSNIFYIYRILKYNQTSKLLYCECNVFKNITQEKATKKIRDTFFDEYSIVTYHESFKKKKKKNIAIYVINTFSKNVSIFGKDYTKNYLLLMNLINHIIPSFKKSQYFYFINKSCLCIIDFKPKSLKEIKEFTNLLNKNMHKLTSLNEKENLDYSIGVNHEFNYKFLDLKDAINLTLDSTDYLKNSAEKEKIIYYNKNINLDNSYHSIVIEEINRLIKFNGFKILYTPYADIKSGKTKGYFGKIEAQSDFLTDINTIEIEALKQGKENELLNLIISASLKTFLDAGTNKRRRTLFIPLFVPYLAALKNVLSDVKEENTQFVIILDHDTIINWDKENETNLTIDFIKNTLRIGVLFALFINKIDIQISNELLNNFTYIVFSSDLVNRIKFDYSTRIIAHEYINKNHVFNYVASGIDSWAGTEMLLALGFNYLSGPIIATSNETLENVSKKTSKRILDYND